MRVSSNLARRNAAAFFLGISALVCAAPAQSVVWTPSGGGLGFGNDLATIGDLDADGADDFCVGRRDGVVEIVSGRTGGLIRSHSCPTGSDATRVAALGDVDADGKGDYAIGAGHAANPNLGSLRAEAGWVAVFSGATGVELWHNYGNRWYTEEGSALAAVGDVDGNGCPDLLVGAFGWPGFGTGRNSGRAAVRDGLTGALLWEVTGAPSPAQKLGARVAGCGGDVDGDGRPDVAVRSVDPSQVQIFSGLTGALLRTWTGPDYQDVDGLGDVDGDGVADVVIGIHDLPNENGTARVYSGASGAELRAVTFSKGAWTGFGGRVKRLGDLSGDGVAEYAVGCLGTYTYATTGWARVYDGATGALRTCMDGSLLTGKLFGASLAAGDADGDGRPDLLVGAPAYRPGILEPGRVEV